MVTNWSYYVKGLQRKFKSVVSIRKILWRQWRIALQVKILLIQIIMEIPN